MAVTSTHLPTDQAGTRDQRRTLLVSSVVAAVLGAGLMVLVHESVHLITGLVLGIPGTLYSFGVDHSGNPTQNAIMAGSAVVFSLVSGLLMALWQPLRRSGGFGHLLWLWFAWASMMEGIGYLEIAPFGAGDTAAVVSNMGWPEGVAWGFFAVGLAGQFLLAWSFAKPVGRIAGADMASRRNATFWPWLIATVVNVLLSLLSLTIAAMPLSAGEATVIVLAGTATLVFAPMALIFRRVSDREPFEPPRLRPLPVAGLVALAVLIVINLLLDQGLRVG